MLKMPETIRVKTATASVALDSTFLEITITGPQGSGTTYLPLFLNTAGVTKKKLLVELAACIKALADRTQE